MLSYFMFESLVYIETYLKIIRNTYSIIFCENSSECLGPREMKNLGDLSALLRESSVTPSCQPAGRVVGRRSCRSQLLKKGQSQA